MRHGSTLWKCMYGRKGQGVYSPLVVRAEGVAISGTVVGRPSGGCKGGI